MFKCRLMTIDKNEKVIYFDNNRKCQSREYLCGDQQTDIYINASMVNVYLISGYSVVDIIEIFLKNNTLVTKICRTAK